MYISKKLLDLSVSRINKEDISAYHSSITLTFTKKLISVELNKINAESKLDSEDRFLDFDWHFYRKIYRESDKKALIPDFEKISQELLKEIKQHRLSQIELYNIKEKNSDEYREFLINYTKNLNNPFLKKEDLVEIYNNIVYDLDLLNSHSYKQISTKKVLENIALNFAFYYSQKREIYIEEGLRFFHNELDYFNSTKKDLLDRINNQLKRIDSISLTQTILGKYINSNQLIKHGSFFMIKDFNKGLNINLEDLILHDNEGNFIINTLFDKRINEIRPLYLKQALNSQQLNSLDITLKTVLVKDKFNSYRIDFYSIKKEEAFILENFFSKFMNTYTKNKENNIFDEAKLIKDRLLILIVEAVAEQKEFRLAKKMQSQNENKIKQVKKKI